MREKSPPLVEILVFAQFSKSSLDSTWLFPLSEKHQLAFLADELKANFQQGLYLFWLFGGFDMM